MIDRRQICLHVKIIEEIVLTKIQAASMILRVVSVHCNNFSVQSAFWVKIVTCKSRAKELWLARTEAHSEVFYVLPMLSIRGIRRGDYG